MTWGKVLDPSPKDIMLVYINQEPVFSDTFPDTVHLDADYSSYITYGHYKWVKIPVQVIEYKFNKAGLDDYNKFDLLPPENFPKEISPKHGGTFSLLKPLRYIIYPYCDKRFKKKLLKLYHEKQLVYIIDPKFLNGETGYYGALAQTILEENLKYSSQLYPFPWKITY